MKAAISSMVTPVSLMDACTLSSRFKLSMDAGRGESLGFSGDSEGVALDGPFDGLRLFGVAGRIGTLGAFPPLSPGDGMSASSGVEQKDDDADDV